MRILRFFFQMALLVGVIAGFLYFIGGYLWILVASFPFMNDIRDVTLASKHLNQYEPICQTAPSSSRNSVPIGFQVRFLDETNYSVELLCTLIEGDPIHVRDGKLPPLLTRAPGSAGLYYSLRGDNYSTIGLSSLGKTRVVEMSGDYVRFNDEVEIVPGPYPKAECKSFGYFCCNQDSETGVGDPLSTGVTDCAGKCFRSCESRPFVELFSSDPVATLEKQEIVMNGDSIDVLFNYGVQVPKDSKVAAVTIDFGDGATQNSMELQGIFTHTFTCERACRIPVKLKVTDSKGKTSVETQSTTIYIVRR